MFSITIIFLFGLAIGSFINALVYRLHAKKKWIRGRSICPKCKHQLAWHDLIPIISFVLLKGHCRYCHKKISLEYPLVELATAVIFIAIYLSTFFHIQPEPQLSIINYQLLINLFIASILIIVFIYDLKHYLILDKVIVPAIVIVFIANVFLNKSWLGMLISAFAISVFFLLQFLISKGKWIGLGDLRLGFFMGVVLGWPNALAALFLAYILGSIISVILVLIKAKNWQSQIPFACFLCPATFIVMLWGSQLLQWYLKIL